MNLKFNYKVVAGQEKIRTWTQINKVYHATNAWLNDERNRLIGSRPGSTGRYRRGLRHIILNKKRTKRGGKWSGSVVGQWKGKTFVNQYKIEGSGFEAGLFKSNKGIRRSLVKMHLGYTQHTSKFMIVPIYKNLAKVGYTGPFYSGKFSGGLKSKALKNMMDKMTIMFTHDKIYYYNKSGYNKRRKKFKKSDLLFIGTKSIKVNRQFEGKYDVRTRYRKQLPSMLTRGQKMFEKSIDRIIKGK